MHSTMYSFNECRKVTRAWHCVHQVSKPSMSHNLSQDLDLGIMLQGQALQIWGGRGQEPSLAIDSVYLLDRIAILMRSIQ